jgi:threonine/homoserine/homoserine lactone efflux protein
VNTAWAAFVSGTALGLSAGLSPGPLLTLVMTETLRSGIAAGIRLAAAPLITDAPIIVVALVLMPRLNASRTLMGFITLAGAAFITWLAMDSIRCKAETHDLPKPAASIWRGVVANALNPSPYLFWFTVGGTLVLRTVDKNPMAAAVFILVFYSCLVGSKMVLAVAVGRSRRFMRSSVYRWTLRLLGVVLLIFAGRFLWQASEFFGWFGG